MHKYINDIYDLCSNLEKETLEFFCYEINNSNADVFIIMAHKAVRLFYILLEQNHINPEVKNKIIISHLALDFNCDYLSKKRIAIIDDIMISGTSISNTVNKLINIGISQNDINIITLAIDKYYQTMSFNKKDGTNALYCNKELENATCIQLSYTISKIFSYYGLPYNVEFPTYYSAKLKDTDFNQIFNNLLWKTYEVSNESQIKGNVNAYILFPSKYVREILWETIGVNLEQNVHIKIRVYMMNFPSGNKDCSIMPLCLFNEILESDLNKIYNLLKPSNGDIYINEQNMHIAKMRYIQFYIAHKLYLVFNKITSIVSTMDKKLEISTQLLFGKTDGAIINKSLNLSFYKDTAIVNINKGNYVENSLLQKYKISPIGKESYNKLKEINYYDDNSKSFWMNNIIFSLFLWWYDDQEIPVRNQLKNNATHYIRDAGFISQLSNRLNKGFTLKTIQYILNDMGINYESNIGISLFFDRAIDEGIVVPTVYYQKECGYLCRAYRHGEDLPFGIEDQCRLLLFIKMLNDFIPNIQYDPSNNSQGISEISFEKIIVLFYQIGLKKGNIFNRFLGFNNIELIKPFLSVHGKIKGIINSKSVKKVHMYSEKDHNGESYINWLTTWLVNKNFIQSISADTGYFVRINNIDDYLKNNERSSISDIVRKDIENIAHMISTWYTNMINQGKKKDFKDDTIALTSCSDPYVFAAAIATEIHYFSNFWNNQAKTALKRYDGTSKMYYLITSNEDDKKQTSNITQGLNSGRNKVDWYNSERATKIVDEVANLLAKDGASIWLDIWNSIKASFSSVSGSAQSDLKMYTEEAIGYLYFYSACYDCLVHEEFWKSGQLPPKFAEYKALYENQCQKTQLLYKNLFSKFYKIIKINNLNDRKLQFNNWITRNLNHSEKTVSNIEPIVEKHGPNYTVRYKASLIVEINAINPSEIEDIFLRIWQQQNNDIRIQSNIVKLSLNDDNKGFIQYGVFYGICSNVNNQDNMTFYKYGKVLIEFYHKICEAFNSKVYEIKAILLPDTPPGSMFEHSTQKNIIYNVNKFRNNLIDNLRKYYTDNTKRQLVLLMTDFVDPSLYEEVKRLQFDNCLDNKIFKSDECFINILTYYDACIGCINDRSKNVMYSVVKIKIGDKYGAGFLLNTSKQLVCISCNHIFQYYNGNIPITATYDYDGEYSFEIVPIKKIIKYNYQSNQNLLASEEVAVLELKWNGRIPMEIDKILSINDLCKNIQTFTKSDCICWGYPEDNVQCWSEPLYLVGQLNKGYYQTKIKDKSGDTLEGYSGGLVVLNNIDSNIIGIHEGHFGENCGRLIPCSTIIKELERLSLC